MSQESDRQCHQEGPQNATRLSKIRHTHRTIIGSTPNLPVNVDDDGSVALFKNDDHCLLTVTSMRTNPIQYIYILYIYRVSWVYYQISGDDDGAWLQAFLSNCDHCLFTDCYKFTNGTRTPELRTSLRMRVSICLNLQLLGSQPRRSRSLATTAKPRQALGEREVLRTAPPGRPHQRTPA